MKCKDLYHLRLHIGHSYNAGQNFWNIAKKSSKVGKDQKTSKFVFVYILTGIANVFGSGHQANSPLNFDIFLIFLNFIILQVVYQNISHLQQKVFYNKNQVPFYLRQIRLALNRYKCSKYYDQDHSFFNHVESCATSETFFQLFFI